MKIFITGGTGFIGKNLTNQLSQRGHEVVLNYNKEKPEYKHYKIRKENIESDINFFKKEKFDGIIHLATSYFRHHEPINLENIIETNIKFGAHILECACSSNIKWFINTGTFWQHFDDKEYNPVNLYAATKRAFEDLAKYYYNNYNLNFVNLKINDTYGPNDTRRKIFNIWDKISKNNEILEMSLGEQLIDILYIDDVVNGFIELAELLNKESNSITTGDSYALYAKKRHTLKELASLFENILKTKLNIKWGGKPYHSKEVMIPWQKDPILPNWEPIISLEDGLIKTFKNS
jgi:CDP-paratose synthetase